MNHIGNGQLKGICFNVLAAIILILTGRNTASGQLLEKRVGFEFEQPGFLNIPGPLAYDRARHRLAVADGGRDLVYIFDLSDHTFQTLGDKVPIKDAAGLAFDVAGALYISQEDNPFILKFPFSIDQPETLGLSYISEKLHPGKILIEKGQEILIADKDNGAVYIMRGDTAGSSFRKLSEKMRQPDGIAINASGEILIADKGFDPILVYNPDGEFSRRLSRPEIPTSEISFSASGLAQDQRGWIYTLDITHSKVVSYDPTGINRTEWAPAEPPFFPEDIAIDRYDAIYISEKSSGRVMILVREG